MYLQYMYIQACLTSQSSMCNNLELHNKCMGGSNLTHADSNCLICLCFICAFNKKQNVLVHVVANQCQATARLQHQQLKWRQLKLKYARQRTSCLSLQLRVWTNHLLTDSTNYACWVEIASNSWEFDYVPQIAQLNSVCKSPLRWFDYRVCLNIGAIVSCINGTHKCQRFSS